MGRSGASLIGRLGVLDHQLGGQEAQEKPTCERLATFHCVVRRLHKRMKRSLAAIDEELGTLETRLADVRRERETHPDEVAAKKRKCEAYLRGELSPWLFGFLSTKRSDPSERLQTLVTKYKRGAVEIKDNLYRDEWSITLTFANGTRCWETVVFDDHQPRGTIALAAWCAWNDPEDVDTSISNTWDTIWSRGHTNDQSVGSSSSEGDDVAYKADASSSSSSAKENGE